MKYKIITLIMMLLLLTNLTACGTKESEKKEMPQKTEEVTSEEGTSAISAESGRSTGNDKDNTTDETDDETQQKNTEEKTDTDEFYWAEAYIPIVNEWYTSHSNQSYIFNLIYLNNDDIPELCLFNPSERPSGIDIYTIIDQQAVRIALNDSDNLWGSSEYTLSNTHSTNERYIANKGIIARLAQADKNSIEVCYMLIGNTLEPIYIFEETDGVPADDHTFGYPSTYTVTYVKKDGDTVQHSEETTEVFETMKRSPDHMSEICNEYNFSTEEFKGMYELRSYKEITEELMKNLPEDVAERQTIKNLSEDEAGVETKKNLPEDVAVGQTMKNLPEDEAGTGTKVDAWKYTYLRLLKDFINGEYIWEGFFNDKSRFLIYDLNNDNIPELLINDEDFNWWAYEQDAESLDDPTYSFYRIIPGTDELIGTGDFYNQAQRAVIDYLDGRSIYLYDEDFGTYSESDSLENEYAFNENHHYTITEYMPDRTSTSRDASIEEARMLMEKYEKEYEDVLGEGLRITGENIRKELELPLSVVYGFEPVSTTSSEAESVSTMENADSPIYQVKVTAPDGYVNFRQSPGTDAQIISQITNGTLLSVYEENSEKTWLRTENGGISGWIAASQVTRVDP